MGDFLSERKLISVDFQQGTFTAKLNELKGSYGWLQDQIEACQDKSPGQLHALLIQIINACNKRDRLLAQQTQGSRMQAVSKLAQMQLEYQRSIESVLDSELTEEMHGNNATHLEARAEACSIFAEYAIDFALQATYYAFGAAIKALELEALVNEHQNEKGGYQNE